MRIMQIFMVIGGFEYEGCDKDSLKAFSFREEALEYGEKLLAGEDLDWPTYDYYEIVVQEL